MSYLRPLSGEERKSNFGAVRSVDDPFRKSVSVRASACGNTTLCDELYVTAMLLFLASVCAGISRLAVSA